MSPQQIQRKQHLRQMCEKYEKEALSGEKKSPQITEQFIVDHTYKIIYCYVPKVACTHWKRVLYALKQSKPYPDLLSIHPSVVHQTNKLDYLRDVPKPEREEKLKNYTKFMFVRDPFVRLISAFRDKFHYEVNHEQFYQSYGKPMLRLYGNQPHPPNTMLEAHKSHRLPTFSSFVKFLGDPKTERNGLFDPHWRQMNRLCQPCLIDYDFIGHQETLEEDAQELLKIFKVENDLKFPLGKVDVTTNEYIMDWFRGVPLKDRKRLYSVYERDFRLFGYKRPDELLDG
ncbi:carbohydrate sulfotransferase 12-like [Leuresthes tenuis]|uniref:carbohydrate sulfotransferase 12-like n=1 Tax=Leuresthes tenuis TaxID=355514 RepID=UPI003B50FD0A